MGEPVPLSCESLPAGGDRLLLGNVSRPDSCLLLRSSWAYREGPIAEAARGALQQISLAVQEEAVYLLVAEIVKSLDVGGKGQLGAAHLTGGFLETPPFLSALL